MNKLIYILSIILNMSAYALNTDAFIVEVSDQGMVVSSPSKKLDTVSIIIKNKTFDKIVSELRSKDKVLKRFVLKPGGRKVLSVDMRKAGTLFYVPVSPPFEAAQLKFKQKVYEIPKKK